MKFLISTFGTRGDVQPYLALAVGLQSVGHRVTLAASHSYTEWIQAYGVNTAPARFNMQEFMQTPEALAIIRSKNLIRQIRLLRDIMSQGVEAQDDVWAAIQDADCVIQSPTGTGALEAANKQGIPAVFAVPVPFAPTRAFPSFFLSELHFSLGAGYNYFTYKLGHRLLWSAMGKPMTKHLRKKLGLRPWRSYDELMVYSRSLGTPWLYGFSPHVISRPTDWENDQHITGYWFLESQPDWAPSTELLHFLDTGSPPIYMGFGSMTHEDPERQTQLALRALQLSGQRGVLSGGWGGIMDLASSPDIFFVNDVPHAWLFPRMAAVVHHGGAGTTGAGLRAGIPNIITPLAKNDQVVWAERVIKLGVGPRVPGIKQLTAEKLAEAIQIAVTDSMIRAHATELGEKIRAEDGLARAIEIIERHVAGISQSVRESPTD